MKLSSVLVRLFQRTWFNNKTNDIKNEIRDYSDNKKMADALLATGFIGQFNQYYPWIF